MELIRVVTEFAVRVKGQKYLRKERTGSVTWYYLDNGQTNLVYSITKRDMLEEQFQEMVEQNEGI